MAPAQEDAPLLAPGPPKQVIHPVFAVVFALNYMMGAGFLTLPRAFVDCTVAGGVALTLVIAFGSIVAAECILDAMSRARDKLVVTRVLGSMDRQFHKVALETRARDPVHRGPPPDQTEEAFSQLPVLCTLFLGERVNCCYLVMLLCYMIGSLWAYAAIFAASLEANFGAQQYHAAFVVLFGLLVIPLTMRDLADQKNMQSILAVGRMVMLAVMIATAALAWRADGPLHRDDDLELPMVRPEAPQWTDVVKAAPVIAFAYVLHHSVPQICTPVYSPHRPAFALNLVFRRAILIATAIYLAFAVTIALYFDNATTASANLDWATFHTADPTVAMQLLFKSISKFVLLYPAINVVAAYPLNAITLGDALISFWHDYINPTEARLTTRPMVLVARLVAGTPPLLGTIVVSDISKITAVTGIFGIAMCGIIPGLVCLASKRMVPGPTMFQSSLNSTFAATALTVCGAALTLSMVFIH